MPSARGTHEEYEYVFDDVVGTVRRKTKEAFGTKCQLLKECTNPECEIIHQHHEDGHTAGNCISTKMLLRGQRGDLAPSRVKKQIQTVGETCVDLCVTDHKGTNGFGKFLFGDFFQYRLQKVFIFNIRFKP